MSTKKVFKILEREKLSKFFNRYKGAYFGILCGFVQAFMLVVSSIVFIITEPINTPNIMITHWISNLGGARNGAQYVFTVCMILTIIFSIPFVLDVVRIMVKENEKREKNFFLIPLVLMILTSIGGLFLTIFNLHDFSLLHVLFAGIFFVSCEFMVFSISLLALTKRNDKKWILQSVLGVPVILFFSLFLIAILISIFEGNVNFMTTESLDPSLNYYRFMEWMSIISLIFWFLSSGILLTKLE